MREYWDWISLREQEEMTRTWLWVYFVVYILSASPDKYQRKSSIICRTVTCDFHIRLPTSAIEEGMMAFCCYCECLGTRKINDELKKKFLGEGFRRECLQFIFSWKLCGGIIGLKRRKIFTARDVNWNELSFVKNSFVQFRKALQ